MTKLSQGLPANLSPSSLSAAFAKSTRSITVMGLGDSITANGGGNYDPSTGTDFSYQPGSWHLYGHLISGARFLHMGNAATAGYTIQQIKTTHLPTVLAAAPGYCIVLAGQNNGATTAQDLVDLLSIYTQLQGAGIIPILCTNPATNTTAPLYRLNAWIARQARANQWPLLDLYAATVDATTGLYKAGYSGDGVHPTETGAKAMGQALATLMQQLIPVPWLNLANSNAGQSTTVANPVFLTDNAGAPPWPTGWAPLTTNAAGASAFSTPAGIVGRRWTITRPTGVDNFVASFTFTVAPGDKILTMLRLSSVVEAITGAFAVNFNDALGNLRFSFTLNRDLPIGSALAWVWSVPAGMPNYVMNYQIRVLAGNAATLSLEQFTSINLTAIAAA